MTKNDLIEVVMIVKNAVSLIDECISHNAPFVDYFTILDTGSTDGTCKAVNRALSRPGLRGRLHKMIFVPPVSPFDFSKARNEACKLARGKSTYILMLDDSYLLEDGGKLREKLGISPYMPMAIQIRDELTQQYYWSTRLFPTSFGVRYKYRVHEELDYNGEVMYLDSNECGYILDRGHPSHLRRSENRHVRDLEALKLDIIDYPLDPRPLYYLAKTYHRLGNHKGSIETYERLALMQNKHEDYDFAAAYDPLCLKWEEEEVDDHEFEKQLRQVGAKFPDRVEPLYKLAVFLKERNRHYLGFLRQAMHVKEKPESCILIDRNILNFSVPYMLMEYYIEGGRYSESVEILRGLEVAFPNCRPLRNVRYLLNPVNKGSVRLHPRTIVFHTGKGQAPWSPLFAKSQSQSQHISASEIVAVKLASEFRSQGWMACVVGNFDQDQFVDPNTGVEFMHYEVFDDFCLQFIVDVLIVSRFVNNIVYYDNVKAVYLWLHDTMPVFEVHHQIQLHKTKFKGIIYVSKWQHDNVVRHLKLGPQFPAFISRNAITPSYFEPVYSLSTPEEEISLIYTSAPDRALTVLLQAVKRLYENETVKFKVKLTVYCNKAYLDHDMIEMMSDMAGYVILRPRLSQEDIAREYCKSLIWCYPVTKFEETYCVAALEAMCGQCLVVTTPLGALKEITAYGTKSPRGLVVDVDETEIVEAVVATIIDAVERWEDKALPLIQTAYEWGMSQNYETLCQEWIDMVARNSG